MRLFASTIPLVLALAAGSAVAQESIAPRPGRPEAGPPAGTQSKEEGRPKAPQRATLDELYERLAKAKDETEGKGIATLIERRSGRSGSDTADLLVNRAGEAAERKDFPLAIELLDRVLVLEPRWAEAWYRRATVFYLLDDPISAMADIRKVLDLEPRHFGAWAGLGHMFMASDQKGDALKAYRQALKIHPQLSVVQTLVERLAPQVDGLDL
jgi:tetratricopeptide (TPR) repeat protein